MSNVLPFTKKRSVLSEAAPQMAEWFNKNEIPGIISNLFLHLSSDDVRDVLNDNVLDNISYGVQPKDDSDRSLLFIRTMFRPNIVPEFGTQSQLDFFSVLIMDRPDEMEPSPFPTEDKSLMQQTYNYFNSYPEINSNLIAFCYQLIRAVLLNDQFKYVKIDVSELSSMIGKFVFGVIDAPGTNLYLFVIDFLPILLDHSATQYWKEKLQFGGEE